MSKMLDLLKGAAGEKSLHSVIGRWRQEVSATVDQLVNTVAVLSGNGLVPATGVTLGTRPLNNYSTFLLKTGDQVYVQNIQASFTYDATSTAAADQISVVSAVGPGRFFRNLVPSAELQKQTVWVVDPVAGFDENDGLTAGTALKTAAELRRRVNGGTGVPWRISADTSITFLNDVPAADPLDLVIWPVQGGFLRIKGTPVVAYTGAIGAVTAINRATNTPYDFTDAVLGVGQVGKRQRMTSGARNGYLTWLAKDLGGGKYRVPPWTFLNTAAASPNSIPDAQGSVAPGDTYVIETLTNIGAMHLRIVGTTNVAAPSANTVPLLMTDIRYTGGFNGGVAISGFPDSTNTPVVYGCDMGSAIFYGSLIAGRQAATTYASAAAGPIGYFGSLIAGDLSIQTGVMAFFDFDTLIQAGRLRLREGGTGRVGSLGVFDSAADGVLIEDASLRTLAFLAGVDALYGAGNAGAGVSKTSAGPNYTYVTKPTITGSTPGTNDAKVGGTNKAWGAIPFIEPANNAAIVAFA